MPFRYAAASASRLAAVGLLLLACGAEPPAGLEPALRFDADPESPEFGVLRMAKAGGEGDSAPEGAKIETERIADAVFVWTGKPELAGDGCRLVEPQPTVMGRVVVENGQARFEPRFAWVPGVVYTACLDWNRFEVAKTGRSPEKLRTLTFSLPERPTERPAVIAVWPDLDEVPANLLRLYVHFSEPMRRRDVADHVRLIDESGEPIAEPFVEIPDGLWDREGRRLTVFVHPGRIKRGVGPREALGPALAEGTRVALEIDGALESALGVPLGAGAVRWYRIGTVDNELPDPERWKIVVPGGDGSPVRIEFDEPLDAAQLATAVRVLAGERAIAGRGEPAADGRSWTFWPRAGWLADRYRLTIRRTLEDLAGNTVERPFDLATLGASGTEVVAPTAGGDAPIELTFEIDPPASQPE